MTADEFRSWRRTLGMTNLGMADALGVPVNTLKRWMVSGTPKRYAGIIRLALERLETRMFEGGV